jgi:hypothetical protein
MNQEPGIFEESQHPDDQTNSDDINGFASRSASMLLKQQGGKVTYDRREDQQQYPNRFPPRVKTEGKKNQNPVSIGGVFPSEIDQQQHGKKQI